MTATCVTLGLGWPATPTLTGDALGWPEDARRRAVASGRGTETADVAGNPTGGRGGDVTPDTSRDDTALDTALAPAGVSRGTSSAGNARALRRPLKTRVMVVANQKGGVGKTTTAVNVAAALAQGGLRVLLIDLDPQGNASTAFAIATSDRRRGSYDVMTGAVRLADVELQSGDVPGVFVVPASIDLAGAEIELVALDQREFRLRNALQAHFAGLDAASRYDFVLIDCPPSLGLLTLNALAAAEELLVPVQCEYYALEGLSQLLRTVSTVRDHVNPSLRVGAIVLTMYDARTRLAAGVADEVRAHFGAVVLETAIPRSVRISEAPSYGQTVLSYDPGSVGAAAYRAAADELAEQKETL